MKNRFSVLNRQGQGLTEYLILVILVCVVSIAGAKSLGNTIKAKLQVARNQINSQVSANARGGEGGDGGGNARFGF